MKYFVKDKDRVLYDEEIKELLCSQKLSRWWEDETVTRTVEDLMAGNHPPDYEDCEFDDPDAERFWCQMADGGFRLIQGREHLLL